MSRRVCEAQGREAAWIALGRSRLVVTVSVFAAVFILFAGRLATLSLSYASDEVASTGHAAGAGASNSFVRREIVDRNGVLLATNLQTKSLYAHPYKVFDADEAATQLTQVFPGLSRAFFKGRLESSQSFVYLKRQITPRQEWEIIRLGIPGLEFAPSERRVYLNAGGLSHTLGYVGVENRGLAGVELYFQDQLTDPAHADEPLALSIDLRVQHALRNELQRAFYTFNAIGGAGVVLDVENGNVLAMASMPDFNVNQRRKLTDAQKFNRATLGVYEMGSVFKVFSTALALETKTVSLADEYDATEPLRVGRFRIRDDHPQKRWLTIPEIFVYSSNIGAAQMARDVGAPAQKKFLEALGLLHRSPIELPEVGAPLYPSKWGEISAMTISYGHGIAVNAVQLTAAMAPMVNGGVYYPPSLIRRLPGEPVEGRRVISSDTSRMIRALMRLAVIEGTGKQADVPGLMVGGKTGTAEKSSEGGYRRHALVSSFIGAFPMDKPKYVVFAMLDEPEGTKETFGYATGGWTAAPVVGGVIARIAPLLGIAPTGGDEGELIRASAALVREKN